MTLMCAAYFKGIRRQTFTFTKVWSGGVEESITWTMYNSDGSVRHKLFDKIEVSDTEWKYVAYFQDDVSECYVIKYPPAGIRSSTRTSDPTAM